MIEVKHLTDWQKGVKGLVHALHSPERKPRMHLFGDYTKPLRSLWETDLGKLRITLTWEHEPS